MVTDKLGAMVQVAFLKIVMLCEIIISSFKMPSIRLNLRQSHAEKGIDKLHVCMEINNKYY